MLNRKILLITFLLISSCTYNGGSHQKHDGITDLISGTAAVDKVKDVHIINLIHAIGAPSNFITIGKFKYYQWNHARTVGVSTLFGGGSTTLYCSLTAETTGEKIKLINWYGNQCGIFLDLIGDYFKNKLNIAVITDEDEKKQNAVTSTKSTVSEVEKKEVEKEKPQEVPQNTIDLRQKTEEQKVEEKKAIQQNSSENKAS